MILVEAAEPWNEHWEHVGVKVSVRMYSHTIVYFYIRTSKNLVNVGSSRHKLPRHLQCRVGDTDPSGQNWSDMSCRADMSRCRRHCQLSHNPKPPSTVTTQPPSGLPIIPSNDNAQERCKWDIFGLVKWKHKMFILLNGTPAKRIWRTSPWGTPLCSAPILPSWGKLPPGITKGNKAEHSERVCWNSQGRVYT
jgi:hypothetical protein